MTHRNVTVLAALPLLLMTGCHMAIGPDDGYQEWWYYCDNSGCYRCNSQGCELPDHVCVEDSDCPGGMTCDPESNRCHSTGPCDVSKQCGSGYVCEQGRCVPGRTPCDGHDSCGDGAYCSNGTCKDSGLCDKDSDCGTYGPGFHCAPRGTCEPGAPPVKSCTSGASCPDGLCVEGSCGACSGDCGGGKTCQFNVHCGAGRLCVDGRCTSACSRSGDCGTGQVCRSKVCVAGGGSCSGSGACSSGQACVNGVCRQVCGSDVTCDNAKDTCSSPITVGSSTYEVCMPDHTARLECKVNKDCTGGEVCVNGVCRTSCTGNDDCAACEDGPVCAGGYCMTAAEANPKCSDNSSCGGGTYCVNAQCKSL